VKLLGNGGPAGDLHLRGHQRGAGMAITPVTMTGGGGVGGPYTFTATGLPAGISISSAALISGTPTVSGTFKATRSRLRIRRAHGNGELLVTVARGDLHLRGHQPRCRVWLSRRDDDGRRRRGWTLHVHGYGPAGWDLHLQWRPDSGTPT